MTRQTSIDAFNEIVANGLLSERRFQVYEILFRDGPLTANQVINIFKIKHPMLNTGAVTTRLSELRNAGVVMELGEIECPVTGNNVIQWDVTGNLPRKVIKPTIIKCKHCKGVGHFEQERLF